MICETPFVFPFLRLPVPMFSPLWWPELQSFNNIGAIYSVLLRTSSSRITSLFFKLSLIRNFAVVNFTVG